MSSWCHQCWMSVIIIIIFRSYIAHFTKYPNALYMMSLSTSQKRHEIWIGLDAIKPCTHLWPISWAIVKAVARPVSSLMLQLWVGSHITPTGAKPRIQQKLESDLLFYPEYSPQSFVLFFTNVMIATRFQQLHNVIHCKRGSVIITLLESVKSK